LIVLFIFEILGQKPKSGQKVSVHYTGEKDKERSGMKRIV
jgi:FKBP-type peptidyl-prolyl cis-trans isomerase